MTPEQITKLEPHARAFADGVFAEKKGAAAINFDRGIVVYVNDAVPGAAEFRAAVRKLFDGLADTVGTGTI